MLAAFAGLLAVAIACSSAGAGGREVRITQQDDGCTPATVSVRPGEKLKLVVKNDAGKFFEIEGIEGTELEEVIIPEGRTREMGYAVPKKQGVYKLKCYSPGDVTTIIELKAEGEPVADSDSGDGEPDQDDDASSADAAPADDTVRVDLSEFAVQPDKTSVKAGNIQFVASNRGAMVHELAVLRVMENGSFENMGELETLPAGESGTITVRLEAGEYQLACLIAAGEAGSTVDHYKQGMHIRFVVE